MKAVMAAIFAVALTATVVSAQTVVTDERGRFVRYDPAAQVIVLDDGRMYRVTPSTVVLLDNRPVSYTAVPGEPATRTGEQARGRLGGAVPPSKQEPKGGE